jgi:hypothetical protein
VEAVTQVTTTTNKESTKRIFGSREMRSPALKRVTAVALFQKTDRNENTKMGFYTRELFY